jgi:hypothetical protein
MAVSVRFACGHEGSLSERDEAIPVCTVCGESQVTRTTARAPRFVGVATGPFCETRALEAIPVNLAPKGALVVKEQG